MEDSFAVLGMDRTTSAAAIMRAYEMRKAEIGRDVAARRELKKAYVDALQSLEDAPLEPEPAESRKPTPEPEPTTEPTTEPTPEPTPEIPPAPPLTSFYGSIVRQAEKLRQ